MAESSTTGRNFIIAGVVLGLGAAAAGYFTASSYDKQTVDPEISKVGAMAAETQKVQAAYESAMRDVVVSDVAPEGAWIVRDKAPEGKEPRYTPIFFAPKLWTVRTGENSAAMRDLQAPEDPQKPNTADRVHKDVPNEWFFRYGLEGIIGYPDAMTRDSDGDGYTNEEEHAAGTDPSDAKKHPPFIVGEEAKMICVKRHTGSHWLELSNMSDPAGAYVVINSYKDKELSYDGRYQLKELKVGDTFGLEAGDGKGTLGKDRFKVVAIHTGDVGVTGVDIEDTYTKLEAAKTFTIQTGKPKAHKVDDTSVELVVTAGAAKGKQVDHPVQVGETFSVPGFSGTECTLVAATKKEIRIKVGEHEVRILSETTPSKEKSAPSKEKSTPSKEKK